MVRYLDCDQTAMLERRVRRRRGAMTERFSRAERQVDTCEADGSVSEDLHRSTSDCEEKSRQNSITWLYVYNAWQLTGSVTFSAMALRIRQGQSRISQHDKKSRSHSYQREEQEVSIREIENLGEEISMHIPRQVKCLPTIGQRNFLRPTTKSQSKFSDVANSQLDRLSSSAAFLSQVKAATHMYRPRSACMSLSNASEPKHESVQGMRGSRFPTPTPVVRNLFR